MTHEQNGPSLKRNRTDLPQALLLKRCIANRQHFVDDQNVRFEVRRDCKCQPHVHAARITFDRSVDKLVELCESHDLVELPRDLGPLHSQHGAVEKDVFAASKFRMKTGSYLEQTRRCAVDLNPAFSWLRDSREYFQEG